MKSLTSLSIRDLTKNFKASTARLKPGQTVPVTSANKIIGSYTRAPDQAKLQAALERSMRRMDRATPAEKKASARLYRSILRDVA